MDFQQERTQLTAFVRSVTKRVIVPTSATSNL